MKVCIVGAGSIGGLIGARLGLARLFVRVRGLYPEAT